MRKLCFLINPNADSGRRWGRLAAEIAELRPQAEVLVARHAGDLHQWARQRRDAGDLAVIAVGGDGTAHLVGNGLIGGRVPMGLYAAGTGNDFAKMLTVPKGLEQALSFFESAVPRPSDVGRIKIHHLDGAVTEGYFINSLGVGLEAQIAESAARARLLRGFSRYLVAALRHLLTYRPPSMRLVYDDIELEQQQFLVAVGNGCCAGGSFRLFPRARIDDGLFELVWADTRSRMRLLRILPTALKGGHLRFPEIRASQVSELTIECAAGCAVHADGEVLAGKARHVRVDVLANALQMLG